jgi:hypothetical protein
MISRRTVYSLTGAVAVHGILLAARAAELPGLPVVRNVELQPLVAQVRRVIEATDYLGTPLSAADKAALDTAFQKPDADEAGETIQRALDKY